MSVILRCSSSLELAMASSLRRIHNLSSALSWSSAFPVRNKFEDNGNYFGGARLSVFPPLSHSVECLRSSLSNRSCSKDVVRKRSNERLDFTLVGSAKTGSIEGRTRDFASRKSFVVTRTGPLELSIESSFGQVSGNLEQESEDASGESYPHETYQSPHGCLLQTETASPSQIEAMAELEDALGFPLGHEPQAPSPKPLVVVISGPSGVGKDAVIKKLQQIRRDIHFVVTATTRPMRPGEIDGVDYHFMSKTEFQEMIENHELLEHAIVYGDYKGIPKQQVREFMSQGMDVVLRVDVQGAATVRSILGSEAVFIFLVAETEVALVKRLIERKTETMDKMLVRVATAREELTRMEEFDYVVENQEGCIDRTVSLICSIIDAEKARVKPKVAEI